LLQVNSKRTAILDAAESLFAEANFDIVGIRDVAAKARVPLGLICYHFCTKDKLYEAIIARRSDDLNKYQLGVFKTLPAKFDLRHVIDVFLRSYFELMLRDEPGWRSYWRLLAQMGQQRRGARLLAKHFRKNQGKILDALVRAEPRLSNEAVIRGYGFMLSMMFGMFAKNDLLSMSSDKAYRSRDIEAAYVYAVPFLTGAFERLLTADSANARICAGQPGERRSIGQSG
jgi:AcrR family transcriptional regulator